MKKIFFCYLILIFTTVSSFAQNTAKDKDKSNVEKFSARSGTLIKKEFLDIGAIKRCKIQILRLTDLVTNSKQSGIRFTYDATTSYGTDTKTAVLDIDELDGFMKAIQILQKNVLTDTPTTYTETFYKSRSGFEGGCFWSKGTWSCYLKLEEFDSKSYVWIEPGDLESLYSLLEKAKAKL